MVGRFALNANDFAVWFHRKRKCIRLPPVWQRHKAGIATFVGTLIDVQKIRLTHVVAARADTARATPNIIPTNDFHRCVKRSHCSIAEVPECAGEPETLRSAAIIFAVVNDSRACSLTPITMRSCARAYYIELSENSSRKQICKISFALHDLPSATTYALGRNSAREWHNPDV